MSGKLTRAATIPAALVGLVVTMLSLTAGSAVSDPPPGSSQVQGLSVVGAELRDDNNDVVQLRGANVMGTEYACIGGWGFSDRMDDPADRERALDAMESWAINTVRVPLNSDCWFGTKPDLAGNAYVGAVYQAQMIQWINQITSRGMVAVADLHWTAPDGALATGQPSMADIDTSVAFWHEVAAVFGDNTNVVFDLFNEPYLNREFEEGAGAAGSQVTDLDSAWACWADGCTATRYDATQSPTPATYEAAGMQDLIDAVRAEGATNVLLISGLQYSQYFDRLAVGTLPVTDPLDSIAISFHAYPGNPCGLDNNPCRAELAAVASHHPVIVGEFGRGDCKNTNIDNFLDFADVHGISYLGWQWLPLPSVACNRGRYELTKDPFAGAPSKVGSAVKTHYLERVQEGTEVLVATTSLAPALAGKAYTATLTATGGLPAYKWSIAAGSLPPGLRLSAAGKISGTPAGPGTWSFAVQVADRTRPVKYVDTRSLSLTVTPMTVATSSLPPGAVGLAYKAKLVANGGKGLLKWRIEGGALPPGVKLASSGALSGKPTTAGSYDVTVRVTDTTRPTANTATDDFTIVISP